MPPSIDTPHQIVCKFSTVFTNNVKYYLNMFFQHFTRIQDYNKLVMYMVPKGLSLS